MEKWIPLQGKKEKGREKKGILYKDERRD